jgi:hypothetical protein
LRIKFPHWLGRTPAQTFILCPLAAIGFELTRQGGVIAFVPWGVPLLAWGYLQYRLVGRYRRWQSGGGALSLHAQPDVSRASHSAVAPRA